MPGLQQPSGGVWVVLSRELGMTECGELFSFGVPLALVPGVDALDMVLMLGGGR